MSILDSLEPGEERVESYIEEAVGGEAYLFLYGIDDTSGDTVTVDSDLDAAEGVTYHAALIDNENRYDMKLDAFLEQYYGEEKKDCTVEEVEEHLEPLVTVRVDENPDQVTVADNLTWYNPKEGFAYLRGQLERADERINRLRDNLQLDEEKKLRRRILGSKYAPVAASIIQGGIGSWALAEGNDAVGLGLGTSAIVLFPQENGLAGKYLERVLEKEEYQVEE